MTRTTHHAPQQPPSSTISTTKEPNHLPVTSQFLLLGDSITQCSIPTPHALHPFLSAAYSRRLDVLNRGLSGYTTKAYLPLMPSIFPIPGPSTPPVPLAMVFFGANDACLPGNAQHVPLEEFTSTLRQIVNWEAGKKHGTTILVVTPPPVDEWQLAQDGVGGGTSRTAENVRRYAAAARRVARECSGEGAQEGKRRNVLLVDCWTLFMEKAGWKEGAEKTHLPGDIRQERNEVFARLLSDGLHFTDEGYELLVNEMMRVIAEGAPGLCPERMGMVYDDWQVAIRR